MNAFNSSSSRPLAVFLLLPLLLTSISCDSSGAPAGMGQDEMGKQITELIDGVMKNSDVPIGELKKLHQFEYQVIRMSRDSSPKAIEGALDELGKQRWDCFHIEKQTLRDAEGQKREVFTFFCKRRIETPLQYVPRSILGR